MIENALIQQTINHPFFGIALTISVYLVASRLYSASGELPFLHPVLTSVAFISVSLWGLSIDYELYLISNASLHMALGVFVVLLSVPLFRRWNLIKTSGPGLIVALVFGSIVAVMTAVGISSGLGADSMLISSLAPKSATAPVALGVAERLGGSAGLAAMLAVLTGIFGAVAGPRILIAAGIRDERAAGFALGVVSHAIGTARAFQISHTAGAFASLGLVLNALLTVMLAPMILSLVTR